MTVLKVADCFGVSFDLNSFKCCWNSFSTIEVFASFSIRSNAKACGRFVASEATRDVSDGDLHKICTPRMTWAQAFISSRGAFQKQHCGASLLNAMANMRLLLVRLVKYASDIV